MTHLDRRHLLAAAAGAACLSASPAIAQVARRPTSQGAFRRFMLGEFEVTCLLDGGMQGQAAGIPRFFVNPDMADIARLRERSFFVEEGLHQPVGSYLVNTGRNLILVDSGGHSSFFATTGLMMPSLRASGYRPEDVDTVLLTHIHPEHALGLVGEGETRAFPNAVVHVTEEDFALWIAPDAASRVPQGQRFADAATRAIAPYRAADRIRRYPMMSTQEIMPGVTVVPAPGHTPGHVSYRFASGSEQMLVWGDVTHQTVIQLARPRLQLSIDVDRERAVESRLRTLDMLVTDRILVGGTHLPWPAVGRIVRDGEGFMFVPRPWQLG